MRLKIVSRKSDLARIQAQNVGNALKAAHPHVEIEYQFRESLGDQNLSNPLWKMPEKGVFTEDFHQDLVSGTADLVVHSWKDLPTGERPDTVIAATMKREDPRDIVLFKKKHRKVWSESRTLRVFSSSPRREYNLSPFLKTFLPSAPREVEFHSVRGNVQTRIRKLLEDEKMDALVVAKAALDRLLSTTDEEFEETKSFIKKALTECDFLVAPISQNPVAAAQGALAIEVKRDRTDLLKLLRAIHDPATFSACEEERRILKKYGGGCHQKIGISILGRSYGKIISVKGLTDTGEKLDGFRMERERKGKKVAISRIFPSPRQSRVFFDRKTRPVDLKELEGKILLVARENALPRNLSAKNHPVLWTAGLSTWKALTEAGYWVSGTLDGLGELEVPNLSAMTSASWLKLSHAETSAVEHMPVLATYELIQKETTQPDFSQTSHFYWMSASSFEEAMKTNPEILTRKHFCGPGNTYEALRKIHGESIHLEIELSYSDFIQNWLLPAAPAIDNSPAGKKAARAKLKKIADAAKAGVSPPKGKVRGKK